MRNDAGSGKAYAWLVAHTNHHSDDCLIWPFSRRTTGYGALGYRGKLYFAHRMMCEMVHGAPPSSRHVAAHECDNGMGGCVNPNHMRWKTPSENQLDRRRNGTTVTNPTGRRGKLTPRDKITIREMRGRKTQVELAKQFGVHFQTISRIQLAKLR